MEDGKAGSPNICRDLVPFLVWQAWAGLGWAGLGTLAGGRKAGYTLVPAFRELSVQRRNQGCTQVAMGKA